MKIPVYRDELGRVSWLGTLMMYSMASSALAAFATVIVVVALILLDLAGYVS